MAGADAADRNRDAIVIPGSESVPATWPTTERAG